MRIVKISAYQDKLKQVKVSDDDPLLQQVVYLEDLLGNKSKFVSNQVLWKSLKSKDDLVLAIIASLSEFGTLSKDFEQIQEIEKQYLDKIDEGVSRIEYDRIKKSIDNLKKWQDCLRFDPENKTSYKYDSDPAFMYIAHAIFNASLSNKEITKITNPNKDAFEAIYEKMLEDIDDGQFKNDGPISLLKDYRKVSDSIINRETIEEDNTFSYYTGWIVVPSTSVISAPKYAEDIRKFDKKYEDRGQRQYILRQLANGTGWCIQQFNYSRSYLDNGDFWIYLDNGKAQISLHKKPTKLSEIRGINNFPETVYVYAYQLKALSDKYPELGIADPNREPYSTSPPPTGDVKNLQEALENHALVKDLQEKDDEDIIKIVALKKKKIDTVPENIQLSFIKNQDSSERDYPFFYLTSDKINNLVKNESFLDVVSKTTLAVANKHTDIQDHVLFIVYCTKFPEVKKNPLIQQQAVEIVKSKFSLAASIGESEALLRANILANLNSLFYKGNLIWGNDEIFASVEKFVLSYLNRLEAYDKDKQDELIEIIEKLVYVFRDRMLAEASPVKGKSFSLIKNFLLSGNIENALKLQKIFKFSNFNKFSEENAQEFLSMAVDLWLNDDKEFEKFDELFNNYFSKLPEEFLLKEGEKIATEQFIKILSNPNFSHSNDPKISEKLVNLNAIYKGKLVFSPEVQSAFVKVFNDNWFKDLSHQSIIYVIDSMFFLETAFPSFIYGNQEIINIVKQKCRLLANLSEFSRIEELDGFFQGKILEKDENGNSQLFKQIFRDSEELHEKLVDIFISLDKEKFAKINKDFGYEPQKMLKQILLDPIYLSKLTTAIKNSLSKIYNPEGEQDVNGRLLILFPMLVKYLGNDLDIKNNISVLSKAKELFINAVRNYGIPYWNQVLKELKEIYGKNLISNEDIKRLRSEKAQKAVSAAIQYVDALNYIDLHNLMLVFPTLIQNKKVFAVAINKSVQLLSGFFAGVLSDEEKLQMFNQLDKEFNFLLSQNTQIKHYLSIIKNNPNNPSNNPIASTWYTFFKSNKTAY